LKFFDKHDFEIFVQLDFEVFVQHDFEVFVQHDFEVFVQHDFEVFGCGNIIGKKSAFFNKLLSDVMNMINLLIKTRL
jgi:hypothetical protein